ncbi:MAG: hypothetical protein H7287_00830, partial [Thermoleophilia bacterium]|nr:hypothetical protein [Thermoleophilia bacterium]
MGTSSALAAGVGYTAQPWAGCEGGFNAGSSDASGRTYVPCGTSSVVGVYDASGALVDQIDLGVFATDVAPTRDGSAVYVANYGRPFRMERQSDGTWRKGAWSPAAYQLGGQQYAAGGLSVATDAAGNVYLADGAWAPNQTNTVVKYGPDGRVL